MNTEELQEMVKNLEERIKRLESWIQPMHEILLAHSRFLMLQVDESMATHPIATSIDEAHERMAREMFEHLLSDEIESTR